MDGNEPTVTQRPVDQVIAGLCNTIASQRDQIKALEALATSRGDDAATFKVMVTQAWTALHDEQEAHARTRERYERAVAEAREMRSQLRVAA